MPASALQLDFLQWLQQGAASGSERLAHLLSSLGAEHFYLFLVALLFWFGPWLLALRVARVVIFTDFVGEWIKWTVGWPRPPIEMALAHETSPGFVSTHAALACAVSFVLGHDAKKARPWLVLWVVGVSWSRLRLGVHYPADILGGWSLGCLVALLMIWFGEESRDSAYRWVLIGLFFACWWPDGGLTALQRDLGLLFGLEFSLLMRRGGGEPPAFPRPLKPFGGLVRGAILVLFYFVTKAYLWPRLIRYALLAVVIAWRPPPSGSEGSPAK